MRARSTRRSSLPSTPGTSSIPARRVDRYRLRYLHCAHVRFSSSQEVMEMALLMRPEPLAADFDPLCNALFEPNQVAQRGPPPMDLVEHDDHFLLRADL